MNKGIEILLARMESNPEEFVPQYDGGTTKWNSFMQRYRPFLSKEDLEIFDAKHKETVFEYMQEDFTQAVMKELLDPKPLGLEDVIKQYRATGISSVGTTLGTWGTETTTTGTTTLNANTLTLGDQTLDAETIEHIKAHLDYIKKQEVQEAKKKATPR